MQKPYKMKKSQLRKIIKEEISKVLSEEGNGYEARLGMIMVRPSDEGHSYSYKADLYKDGEFETEYGPYNDFDSEEEFMEKIIPYIKNDYKLDRLYVTHRNDPFFKKTL